MPLLVVKGAFGVASRFAPRRLQGAFARGEGGELSLQGVDLAAGMIYYSLAYSLKARTCVNLGSGGGFVPRMLRQAQRDLAPRLRRGEETDRWNRDHRLS